MTEHSETMKDPSPGESASPSKSQLQPPNPNSGSANEATALVHEAATANVESEASGLEPCLGTADHPADSKIEPCGEAQHHISLHVIEKNHLEAAPKPPKHEKEELSEGFQLQSCADDDSVVAEHIESAMPPAVSLPAKLASDDKHEFQNTNDENNFPASKTKTSKSEPPFLLDGGSSSGTEEEQSSFMKELDNFFRERGMEFKPPKFYGEELNCLKLWRTVMRLGGYDKVTSCKMWRHVGDSFKPPKTCTTVSWTFRGFYEKALLDYERHKVCAGELDVLASSHSETMYVDNQAPGSGRARRDSAVRAMQGWHSPRHLGTGEVSDPMIKETNVSSSQKREKQIKGLLKRKKPASTEDTVGPGHSKPYKLLQVEVVDIGTPAEWVKINVQETKDCFEVYALVPGLLREEVRVQSDPAGRLVISGEPQNLDNPWGVKPFKKIVNLPSKIEPHLTSAVVTLHGQLFVRAPFDQHSN